MTESQHIAAIEHDLQQAANKRGRAFIDDIDAAALLKELTRLRSQTMYFAEGLKQLSDIMAGYQWTVHGLVPQTALRGCEKHERPSKLFPAGYVRQRGDCDCGFYGDSYFPASCTDNEGNLLYLHVSWTE